MTQGSQLLLPLLSVPHRTYGNWRIACASHVHVRAHGRNGSSVTYVNTRWPDCIGSLPHQSSPAGRLCAVRVFARALCVCARTRGVRVTHFLLAHTSFVCIIHIYLFMRFKGHVKAMPCADASVSAIQRVTEEKMYPSKEPEQHKFITTWHQ